VVPKTKKKDADKKKQLAGLSAPQEGNDAGNKLPPLNKK
jgi:hypothetical protein